MTRTNLLIIVNLLLGAFLLLNPTRVLALTTEQIYATQRITSTPHLYGHQISELEGKLGALAAFAEGNDPVVAGALPVATQTLAFLMTTPPANTHTYIADVIHNIRMPGAQPAYAQGIGFSSLTPVLDVWKVFRNLAYFLFIIIFVIVGFMIMFRTKISSNAVATVQEALPKIIVTLLMITFSYAIAGFVIDLMYLSIFIIIGLFDQFNLIGDAETARSIIFHHNIVGIGIQYLIGPGQFAGEASQAVSNLVMQALSLDWLKGIANILFYLIILVAILVAVFRTLFQLISAYISIIISVIFAPIQLLMNAIPGNDTFQQWIQGLFANAAIFPAAAVMIIIGAALVGAEGDADADRLGLLPPSNNFGWVTGGQTGFVPPLLGGGSPEVVRAIIGIGIIMLLPEVTKMVHEAFKYKAPWYGEAAMKNIAAGTQHGPFAWVSGGANFAGKIVTGAATEAAGTIIGHRLMNMGPLRNMSQRALQIQAQRQAEQVDATERYAEENNLRRTGYYAPEVRQNDTPRNRGNGGRGRSGGGSGRGTGGGSGQGGPGTAGPIS